MRQSSSLLTIAAGFWALGALPTLAAGLAGWDPVGRLRQSGQGRGLRAQWAWFLFELPALLTFPAIYLASGNLHLIGNIALAFPACCGTVRGLANPLPVRRSAGWGAS